MKTTPPVHAPPSPPKRGRQRFPMVCPIQASKHPDRSNCIPRRGSPVKTGDPVDRRSPTINRISLLAKGNRLNGHPIAPTNLLQGPVRLRELVRQVMTTHYPETETSSPQKEDTDKSVTSSEDDGYQPRLTPRNLMKFLAKGQSSTDLIHTHDARDHGSFGHLVVATTR